MSLLLDAMCEYLGFHGCRSVCGLRVYKHDRKHLFIVTELDENKGTSVSNCAVPLANALRQEWKIGPENFIWIEHYPANPHLDIGADFDIVEFDLLSGSSYANPRRRRLSQRELEALIGEAWVDAADDRIEIISLSNPGN